MLPERSRCRRPCDYPENDKPSFMQNDGIKGASGSGHPQNPGIGVKQREQNALISFIFVSGIKTRGDGPCSGRDGHAGIDQIRLLL